MIMAFKIYLTNVKWDNSQKENIRFNSRNDQREYFNIPNIFTTSLPNVNFKINDGISAQAYYYSENTLANTLNYNYAIILDEQEINDSLKYKFYFVNRITHDSNRKCYNLELFLDIIQTYYIDLVFDDCLINRAHLDRFSNNNKINYNKDSKLYKKEDFSFTHNIITRYYDCKPKQSNNNIINDWLHKNVKCWCYYFIKPKTIDNGISQLENDYTLSHRQYHVDQQVLTYIDTNETVIEDAIGDINWGTTQKYMVLVAPIYTGNNRIYLHQNYGVSSLNSYLSSNNIKEFIDKYDLSANIISVKFSRLSPFSECFLVNHYKVEKINNDIYISRNDFGTGSLYHDFFFVSDNRFYYSVSLYRFCALPLEYIDYNNLDIITSLFRTRSNNDNVLLNNDIKTWNGEAKEDIYNKIIRINDGLNRFDYNVAEIYSGFGGYFYLKYIEVLSIDINRYFIYLSKTQDSNNIISNIDEQSVYFGKDNMYIGLSGSIDLSIPYSVEQLDLFMANNKNFYMQFGNKQLYKNISNVLNVLSSPNNKTAVNVFNNIIGMQFEYIDRDLSIDNLANAPDNIENMNGNPFNNVFYNGLKIRIEYSECFDADKKTYFWYLKRYGYKYNELDNVKTVDNIRHYFNYVKCDIDNVNAVYGLSIALKDEIRKIFNNGICLWRYIQGQTGNLFDYSVINYEEKFN